MPGPDLDADTLYDIAAVLRQAGATVVQGGPGRAGIYEHVIVGALAAVNRCLLAGLSVAEMDVQYSLPFQRSRPQLSHPSRHPAE